MVAAVVVVKQDDNTTIPCKEKPRRSNKRRASHYRSNSWNFLATKDGQNSFTSKGNLDASNIMQLRAGIITGALLKDYAVYKKWI